MSEFVQASYNKYEHDYVERTDESLQERLSVLAVTREYGVGQRREQIEREMGLIAFEMSERLREQREQEISEAWSQYDRILEA